MIIDDKVETKLNDINWSLGFFDFTSDVIVSNLTTLKEELPKIDPARGKVFSEFNDIIRFKSLGLYSTLMKIEETVLGTTLAFYKKYHGPFREEIGGGALADVERNLIYSFESFLTQYKSLLDISIKFAFSLCSVGKESLNQVDSFEKLMEIKKKEPYHTIIDSSGLFSDFIAETTELQDIKNYRDYIIHHAYLNPERSAEGIGGHQFFKYWLPRLTQTGKRKYTTDPKSLIRLDYFCRKKLYILLSIIEKLTDNLFTDQIKKSHIEALKNENPEFIKQILLRIAKKEMFADRIMYEDDLRDFLAQRGIDLGEFVEESRWSERESEGIRSNDGKDMSYLREKVFYKPVGNVRIFKTGYVYDRDGKPEEDKPTYGIVVTGVSVEDFISDSQDIARTLTHLRGCGLVYVSNFQGAIRYASVRDDLKALVSNLSELSQFRWSFIQDPEMKYFRQRTSDETENTRRILGKDADEFLKKEDQERERIQEEYREWKKQPKHYYDKPIEVMRDNQVVQRIFHRDFEAEKQQGFVNWKSNKIIHLHAEKDGFINRVENRLVPDDMFSDKMVSEIITKCQETRKEERKHFLDFQGEHLEKHKKLYEEDVKKVKEHFADIIKKYDYLELVFKSINEDVFK
jgi:hypothetical protein